MTDLIKELEAIRQWIDTNGRVGLAPGPAALDNAELTLALQNLIGTLITAYRDEDEMHAVQDDTPDVERGEDLRLQALRDLDQLEDPTSLNYQDGMFANSLLKKYGFGSHDKLREWAYSEGEPFTGRAGSPEAQGTERITVAALAELARAKTKWSAWPVDPVHAFGIVVEEIGEAQAEVLHAIYESANETDRGIIVDRLREECVQSMAMLYRFMLGLETGHYDWITKPRQAGD